MNEAVVKRIRLAMVRRGYASIAALAREVGVSRSYLFRILSGERYGEDVRKKVARSLGITIKTLLAA